MDNSYDLRWSQRFEELQDFKARRGDCQVPASYDENKTLASWVIYQRKTYQDSSLTLERIQLLNEVGFRWRGSQRPDANWCKQFEELQKYREKHGDCNVPAFYVENPSLRHWVRNQRKCYKKKPSIKTREQIQLLNTVGFRWMAKDTPVKTLK